MNFKRHDVPATITVTATTTATDTYCPVTTTFNLGPPTTPGVHTTFPVMTPPKNTSVSVVTTPKTTLVPNITATPPVPYNGGATIEGVDAMFLGTIAIGGVLLKLMAIGIVAFGLPG